MALSVSPPLLEITVAQGGDRSFEVTLTNDGEQTVHAGVRVVDLALDRNGDPHPCAPGSDAWSLASWVTLSDHEIELAPAEQKAIRCRVRVPRGQSGGRYGAVLFTARQDAGLSKQGLRLETRTGPVLMLTIARTERRRASIGEVAVRARQEGGLAITAELRNTGNVHFRAGGLAIIRDQNGRVVARLKMDGGTGTILPGGVREFAATWQRAQPGRYRADLRFTASGLPPVSTQTEISVPLDSNATTQADAETSHVSAEGEAE